jgi:hypothetical protein
MCTSVFLYITPCIRELWSPARAGFFMAIPSLSETMAVVSRANMGFISSAPHKQEAWSKGLLPYPRIIPTPIPIQRGAKEPDIPHPRDTAIGKLQAFAAQSIALEATAKQLDPSATATIADVLFVAGGQVMTTDREKRGSSTMIAELGEILKDELDSGRRAEVEIYCTTGTARLKHLTKYKQKIPEHLIYVSWFSGKMTLAPALIALLNKPKKLFRIHELGVVGSDMVRPRSISALQWPEVVRWLPAIARTKVGRDCWMELELGQHTYHYLSDRTSVQQAEEAAQALDVVVRGIPPSIIPGIVNFYLN